MQYCSEQFNSDQFNSDLFHIFDSLFAFEMSPRKSHFFFLESSWKSLGIFTTQIHFSWYNCYSNKMCSNNKPLLSTHIPLILQLLLDNKNTITFSAHFFLLYRHPGRIIRNITILYFSLHSFFFFLPPFFTCLFSPQK